MPPANATKWWQSLNKRQKALLAVATIGALAAFAYPSWIETYTTPTGAFARTDHGRHWVWDKPSERTDLPSQGVRVHASERSATLIGIALVTITLNFLLADKAGRKSE